MEVESVINYPVQDSYRRKIKRFNGHEKICEQQPGFAWWQMSFCDDPAVRVAIKTSVRQ